MNIPTWADSISTIVLAVGTIILAGATSYYAYQTKKVEEKRIKEKKMALRKLITNELQINCWFIIEKMKEEIYSYQSGFLTELPEIESFEFALYESIADELGILSWNEVNAIMDIYRDIKNLKINYKKARDNSSRVSPDKMKKPLENIMEGAVHILRRHYEMRQTYFELFGGKIDEKELEKRIGEGH